MHHNLLYQHLETQYPDLTLVCSKFGGAPDVPVSFVWPTWFDKPLGFLAQINLQDIAPFDLHHVLPPMGLLSFFYDGLEGYNKEGNRVFWFANTVPLARSQAHGPNLVQTCQITSSPYLELLHFIDGHWQENEWREILDATTAYNFYPERPIDSANKMLGYGDDFGRNSVVPNFNVPNGDYLKRISSIPETVDYHLLLQVDSDDRLGVMWGDAGTVNFMIHKDHLAARHFNEAQLTGTNG